MKSYSGLNDWVDAARDVGSHLASAVELRLPAEWLLTFGLAHWSDGVALSPRLFALSNVADRPSLFGIAQLMLSLDPPPWLQVAVSGGIVAREYIPEFDLRQLEWLEPELDACLLGAKVALDRREDDGLEKRMGDAAELCVVAALAHSGWSVTHVAQVSDSFGYDIEATRRGVLEIEVKASSERTRGSFYLSRNEFEKSQLRSDSWRLWQVVFHGSAIVADIITASHVLGIYELTPASILSVVPSDTPEFRWQESAWLSPSSKCWARAVVSPDPNFEAPGFARRRSTR